MSNNPNDTKYVAVPGPGMIPERDKDKRPVLEASHLGIDFGGLTAVDEFNNSFLYAELVEAVNGVAERAYARQNRAVGGEYLILFVCNKAVAANVLERLADALNIARAVINNSDHKLLLKF